MESFQDQTPNIGPGIPDIVREQLLSAGWGTETYSIDLLELRDEELRMLKQAADGVSIREISRREGVSRNIGLARYQTALGKKEALSGFDSDVLELTPLLNG